MQVRSLSGAPFFINSKTQTSKEAVMGFFFKSYEEKQAEYLQELHARGEQDASEGHDDNRPGGLISDVLGSMLPGIAATDEEKDAYQSGQDNYKNQTR